MRPFVLLPCLVISRSYAAAALIPSAGFAWSTAEEPHVSFYSDAERGVAVALYKPRAAAGKPPRAPGIEAATAAAAGDEPTCPDHAATAAEVAALYAALASPAEELDGADADGAEWQRRAAALTRLRGAFSFVLHDASRNAVLAARDAAGASPLYWGAAADGALLFATHAAAPGLAACEAPTATLFPAGCLFLATGGAHPAEEPGPRGFTLQGSVAPRPGQLRSFARHAPVRVIPRISSRGVLCGAVFRVASAGDLGGAAGAAH